MSVPSKSIDKNKRYAGVKANDFVNKTRTNERSRAAAPSQGWANLGKINSRRIPPPANLPSLKSETGAGTATFDPIIPSTGTSHGWTASGNQTPSTVPANPTRPLTPSKQPTQQQLDSIPAIASTPPPNTQSSSSLASESDRPRSAAATWSNVTAGHPGGGNLNGPPPNLLGLNDFPRLATQDNKPVKSSPDSLMSSVTSTTSGPSFRPANLASWKEGGGRAQPIFTDLPKDSSETNSPVSLLSMQTQMVSSNTGPNSMQNPNNASYNRPYQQQQQQQQQSSQMWSYNLANPYGSYGNNQSSAPMSNPSRHQPRFSSYGGHNQSHSQSRQAPSTDYKTPTILRNKDIDDLSKLTDNVTWASASQEVNYEEKIRFSDDEDNEPSDTKPRRYTSQAPPSRQGYPQVLPSTTTTTTRSPQTHYSQPPRSRLLQDDDHVKQMQDDKNSELINTLTVAKQRRDEQERHLRHKPYEDNLSQRNPPKSFDEKKQIPGYQTRPLLSSTGQDSLSSSQNETSSMWDQSSTGTSAVPTTIAPRTRHDTTDSQTFAMKSWSDQMDSFNYASLHENGQVDATDDDVKVVPTAAAVKKYSRSQSESSSQSQIDNEATLPRSKHFPVPPRQQQQQQQQKPSVMPAKTKVHEATNYFPDNHEQTSHTNEQWTDWEDSGKQSTNYPNHENRYQPAAPTDRRRQQPQQQDERYHERNNDYSRTKQPPKTRPNVARSSDVSATKLDPKTVPNKNQPVWRALSPARPLESTDPTPQEAISIAQQQKPVEQPTQPVHDRRQSAPPERKQRYAPSINTASIPPLMSVRSDVPPTSTATGSKHFKTANPSHYSQRNEFYNEATDATWANDDEYYDEDTGYYDSSMQTHSRHASMGYQSHLHHRGYIALGSYGRYRRGGALRHQQQQYTNYGAAGPTSQLNTSTGSKGKKGSTTRTASANKKSNESSEQSKVTLAAASPALDEPVKKAPAWATHVQPSTIEEIPIIKSTDVEPTNEPARITLEPKPLLSNDYEFSGAVEPTDIDVSATGANKKLASTSHTQRKANKDQQSYQQDQRYQTRQRNAYARSMQDYEAMQLSSQDYYGTTRRTARGGRNARMHDSSEGYYYEHPPQRYSSRYNYSTEQYQEQQPHSVRATKPTTRRGGATGASRTTDRQQNKQATIGSGSTTAAARHHSSTDNDQKEGEEWETASESSTNMRNGQHDNNPLDQKEEPVPSMKSLGHEAKVADRTPPKKSFSSQRPINARYNDRRSHTVYERGAKANRGLGHRTTRLSTHPKHSSGQNYDGDARPNSTMRKDQHRHSLDGYDLNNVAGVVKIETLPAGALEEESTAFDDGGEEFCLVMSKRDRKEQKAAQLSKQNAIESTQTGHHNATGESTIKSILPSSSIDTDDANEIDKPTNDLAQTGTTRTRTGKSLPPRFNGKASSQATRAPHPAKGEQQNSSTYYYDQNQYYYYNQNQYYDQDSSYYSYGPYAPSQRQPISRRKQRNQQQQQQSQQPPSQQPPEQLQQEAHAADEQPLSERKIEGIPSDKKSSPSSNVMSNIQMWNPHTENAMSNSHKLIEKPSSHDRKFTNEMISSNDAPLPLHQRSAAAPERPAHSPVSKSNENIARTIKPPLAENKSDRDTKTKAVSYDKSDTMSSLGSNQLYEKHVFLDYEDKQSIGTVGDDYNQKINSLKTIWDVSDHHGGGQLEQTINTLVAMKQKQDNNGQSTGSVAKESMPSSSTVKSGANTNIPSSVNDEKNNKIAVSTGASSAMNASSTYSTTGGSNKNEQKNICTVKPTQQVAPHPQDQVDVNAYPSFPVVPMPPPMSQASMQQQQQQQHIIPQTQVNALHQQHAYPFFENLLPPPPPPPQSQQQAQQQFNRYPPQNFSYRNTNMYMQPSPSVPNTNSMYHHSSQGSMPAPPQNNAMAPPPPPMPNYGSPFLVDHSGHMMSQPQPPPPPPQAYMNNQMMSGRPQAAQYYRAAPQQQLQTPPGPPYGSQDPLAHSGFYPQFFPPPNSNAPPVGHPSAHNLYAPNDAFHPGHPAMFTRGGSIDRGDHPLMSQPLSRPTNFPSASSNPALAPQQQQQQQQQQPQQQGQPPSLLSQNLKSYHPSQQQQQQGSSSNQGPFYPPPAQANQYARQPMPIGAMTAGNTRQQTQQVPSLMSGLTKNFSNSGNNLNNAQSLFAHRQPLMPPPPANNNNNNSNNNNNRALYQHPTQYSSYSKSAGPNDDNIKPKHI